MFDMLPPAPPTHLPEVNAKGVDLKFPEAKDYSFHVGNLKAQKNHLESTSLTGGPALVMSGTSFPVRGGWVDALLCSSPLPPRTPREHVKT